LATVEADAVGRGEELAPTGASWKPEPGLAMTVESGFKTGETGLGKALVDCVDAEIDGLPPLGLICRDG